MLSRKFAYQVILWTFLGILGFYGFFQLLTHILKLAPEPIGSRSELFITGARETLILTIASGSVGLVIGLISGLAKKASLPLIRWPAQVYIWLIRGTPLLVQILFVYYAIPAIFPSLRLGEFQAAFWALALNVGAYNAEAFRAGIEAVPKGQTEAAESLGFSSFKKMRFIVLPQAIRIVLPPLINNLVSLLKDSSLASSIGLLELSLVGSRISSETFLPVPVLTTVAFVYLALTTVLSLIIFILERKLSPLSSVSGAKV